MRIIIAGGGTGGHLFPGIAIAEEFTRRASTNRILFIGTERGVETKILQPLGFNLRTLKVEGIKGKGIVETMTALLKIPGSLFQSYLVIRDFSPDIVIGVGGYASGPAVLMASILGIKTAITEQNALPGITNKILGKFVDRIFLTFSETQKWFPRGKTMVTGNPIRSSFFSRKREPERENDKFTLLIFGGSQGAHSINMAVLEALPFLSEIKEKLKMIHQTGERDYEYVSKRYESSGMDAQVLPFIMDMAHAYGCADLLICRAGATSLAEITASGKASVLIPFPYAVNDHQTKNAETLVKEEAAAMIPETELHGEKLADTIKHYYHHPELIRKMEQKSARLGNVNAAAEIVDACITLTG